MQGTSMAKKKKSYKQKKIAKVIKEFDEGQLRSGSKTGPVVKKRDQAVAIALNEAKKKKKK